MNQKQYQREYRQKNKEKRRLYSKDWRSKNYNKLIRQNRLVRQKQIKKDKEAEKIFWSAQEIRMKKLNS